jgi:hypothetical protein
MANEKVYVGEDGAKELYRRLKELLGRITGYRKVPGTGNDNHPDVATPDTRIIYLVKIPEIVGEDKYKEWIWEVPSQGEGNWDCIGSTSTVENAWKQWSEDNGSSATGDANGKSIYVGPSNTIVGYDDVVIGKANTVTSYGTHVLGASNTIVGTGNTDLHHSVVIGHSNKVKGLYQVNVFGYDNKIDQTTIGTFNTPIIGYSNIIDNADQCIIMAQGSNSANNQYSTVVGANGSAINDTRWGTVVGNYSSIRKADCATAVGSRIKISKSQTISGETVYQASDYSSAVGSQINVAGRQNSVFGTSMNVNGDENTVIGKSSNITGNYNSSLGGGSITGSYDIVIGADTTVYANGRNDAIIIGRTTGINSTSGDATDYNGTNLISIGEYHSFTQAANAYQIGKNNSVTGNNLASIQSYPHQTAINLGVYNSITMEGVNIGKDNTSERFGVSIGQSNSSVGGSVAIGRETIAGLNSGREGAFTFGSRVEAYAGSMAIGIASDTGFITAGRASSYDGGSFSGSSFALGIGELHVLENSFGIGMSQPVSPAAQNANQVLPAKVSGNSFGIICDTITCDTSSDHRSRIEGNSMGIGSRLTVNQASIGIGYEVHSSKSSLAIGRQLTNISDDAIVFGKLNNNIGSRDSSFTIAGYEYSSASGKAIALGYNNSFIHQESFAVGFNNSSIISKCAVFGNGISNVRDESIALGFSCGNIYNDAIVIGHTNIGVSNTSIAIGKSNYSIDTNSIAIGHGNVNITNASIAMGLSTSAENASIVMGIGNHAIGGAIVFGIGNYSYENLKTMPKFTTNAFIAGLGNTAHSVREKWQNADFASGVNPFGCIIGSYINSYGHNAISIGAFNIVGDSENWQNDTTMLTDNDGFMTAIGYKCEALRNYDFAFGYKSVAKGGENIAINASRAIGFTNIAINHSEIKGVGNIGILESKLVTPIENIYKRGEYYDDEAYNVHNLLFHSNLYHTTDDIYGPDDTEHSPNYRAFQLIDNICIHSNSALIGGSGALFNGNLFAMDDGLTISSPNASNNIIWKMHIANNYHLYGDNIVATGDVCRNMSIGSELNINGIQYYTNNVSLGESKIRLQGMTGAVKMDSNFLFKGNITGSDFGAPNREYAINNNVVMSTSLLELSNDNTIDSCTFNMVLNGSGLRTENTKAYWNGGTNQCSKSNVLFGTYGFGLLGCFSHSDTVSALSSTSVQLIDSYSATFDRMLFDMNVGAPVSGAPDVANAFLRNARLATNFGDNALKNINTALVTGESNWVLGVRSAVVHGNKNTVINTDETIHPMNAMPYVTVIGNDNRIKNSGHGSYFNHNWIEGNYNWVYGSKIADTRIHGTRNIISSLDEQNIPVLTPEEVMALQTQYKTDASGLSCGVFIAAQDGYVYKYNTSGTETTTSIYAGNAYQFTKVLNVAYQQVGLNCDYLNNLAYGSLGYKKLYVPSTFDNAHDVYRITIFGEENSVNSRVAGYSIFGSCNTLRNTLFPNNSEFCIGNGFIQGNDNTVQDGSNIISMGNGNTSIGHNSVAIGSQLKSNQWQTVIGKYNKEIAGPSRIMSSFNPSKVYSSGDVVFYATNNAYYEYTAPQSSSGVWDPSKWTETHPEEDKALFIIGNGYSETDGRNWLDESNIHRSNAMEVYADGTVKARRFISDEPDLELTEGTGIQISKNVTEGTVTVSVTQPLPTAPSVPGTYALQCVVDASGNPTYSWVAIGTANV